MWVALALCVGVLIGPVIWLLVRLAVQTTFDVRFVFGARWKYRREVPWADRPWLWRWPWGVARMWVREFLFSNGLEATGITFKNGAEFRRGRFGRAVRVTAQ